MCLFLKERYFDTPRLLVRSVDLVALIRRIFCQVESRWIKSVFIADLASSIAGSTPSHLDDQNYDILQKLQFVLVAVGPSAFSI
jgi:hypothetical protein